MPKAMLISVGGSPQPILTSIKHFKPSYISFLVSQDSSPQAVKIAEDLKKENINFNYEQVICDDPQDLFDCYSKAQKSVQKIFDNGFSAADVIVDYTGGTKNMSVAIALASVKYGISYSYIGGKERTKDGLGIVIDGTEEVKESINPWDFLAIYESDRIATLFNNYQFKAARQLCDFVCNKTTKYKTLYRKIGLIIEGFYKWDLFCHDDALKMFQRADINTLIHEYDEKWIKNFAQDVLKSIEQLKQLVNSLGKPTMSMIYDLLSNAERRYEEGKIDDAILRLYRVVEMIAQMRLLEKYSINVSDVKIEQLPDKIREAFKTKYLDDRDGKIKIPQNASFILLKELGDGVGNIFVANEKKFMAIQSARNSSYLAHGFNSSAEKTYTSLKEFIMSLNFIDKSHVWNFPKMKGGI
ncbi:MAG: TIGR02710 family CRISPR-associated CARF protein [Thermodesulfovibrionales bacterium]|nr:TIGR02710 family CRISPR-associated CARF protein [Thermodesulfovibrionales bacterium]